MDIILFNGEKMEEMFLNDVYELAVYFENELNINMHLDIVFSDELDAYFNWSYEKEEDQIIINFQVDEGEAKFGVKYAQSPTYIPMMNDVLKNHINNLEKLDYQFNMTL